MFQITRNGQTIATIPADSARAVFTIYASATKRGDTLRLADDSGRTIPSAATASNRWEQGRRNLDDWAALTPYRTAGKPSLSTMARRGTAASSLRAPVGATAKMRHLPRRRHRRRD